MNVSNAELFGVAVGKKGYPQDGLPEVAFAGRSNVGKSSLINAMMNRKALARRSQSPGKTRTINFYIVEKKLYFVDLPGYGYAKLKKTEASRIGRMTENYIVSRHTLKFIILILDIRHEPSDNDKMMFDFLRRNDFKIIIAATKADKLNRSELNKNVEMIKKSLQLDEKDVLIPFSSESKTGRDELWSVLEDGLGLTET